MVGIGDTPMGPDPNVVCHASYRIHGESTIENLNLKYAMVFTRDVCAGDPCRNVSNEFAGALLRLHGEAMRHAMEFGEPPWTPRIHFGADGTGIC